ncbi:MAG: aldose epimerase [Chloroflexi bacterium]|nr:MAG: aldose epimerase [Chloroflexota bacterium]
MTSNDRPSGAQYRIAAGGWSAIVTEVGAALRELHHGSRAVVDGFPEHRMCTGYRGLPLLPWPNRIEDGRYSFDRVDHQLPINRVSEGNAIHGLTCWERWRIGREDPGRVALSLDLLPRPGYPFSLSVAIDYALSDNGLSVTMRARNPGSVPLPFGAGHHPYFLPRATLESARVRVPASLYIALDGRGLPVADRAVDGSALDLRRADPVGALVWMDERFGWLQLYSGDNLPIGERRRSLAIEPMTCPPNAFRSGRDLIALQPGGEVTLRWGVSIA